MEAVKVLAMLLLRHHPLPLSLITMVVVMIPAVEVVVVTAMEAMEMEMGTGIEEMKCGMMPVHRLLHPLKVVDLALVLDLLRHQRNITREEVRTETITMEDMKIRASVTGKLEFCHLHI